MMFDGHSGEGHSADVIVEAEMLERIVRDGERLGGRGISPELLDGGTELGLVPTTGMAVVMIEAGGDPDALNCLAGLQRLRVASMVRDRLREVMDPAPQAALSREEAVGKVALWTAPTPSGRKLGKAIRDEIMEYHAEAKRVEAGSSWG